MNFIPSPRTTVTPNVTNPDKLPSKPFVAPSMTMAEFERRAGKRPKMPPTMGGSQKKALKDKRESIIALQKLLTKSQDGVTIDDILKHIPNSTPTSARRDLDSLRDSGDIEVCGHRMSKRTKGKQGAYRWKGEK